MRRTRHTRPRRSKTRRNQRGRNQRGGGLPYDWVTSAIQHPFYQNSELYKTEPFPILPLTAESIDEVSLEEVAKHFKALVGPIKSYKEFWQTIQAKSEIQIGQGAENEFVSITIPWMEEVEKYLRSSIPQGMNTEGVLSAKAVVTDPKSYPLLIWSLIASAPSTSDMIPVLGP